MNRTLTVTFFFLILFYALGSDAPFCVIKHQGRLLDVSGVPTNGTFSMGVGIFNAATGGVATYTQTVENVVVNRGFYSFTFGTNSEDYVSSFTNVEAWLELSVNGVPFSPRERFVSAPHAVLSAKTEGRLTGNLVKFNNGSYLMHDGTNLFLVSADLSTTNQINQ